MGIETLYPGILGFHPPSHASARSWSGGPGSWAPKNDPDHPTELVQPSIPSHAYTPNTFISYILNLFNFYSYVCIYILFLGIIYMNVYLIYIIHETSKYYIYCTYVYYCVYMYYNVCMYTCYTICTICILNSVHIYVWPISLMSENISPIFTDK